MKGRRTEEDKRPLGCGIEPLVGPTLNDANNDMGTDLETAVTQRDIGQHLGKTATVRLNGKEICEGRILETPKRDPRTAEHRGDWQAVFSVAYRGEWEKLEGLRYANLVPGHIISLEEKDDRVEINMSGMGGGHYNHRFPEEVESVELYLAEAGL